jgi:hypothetical protein
MVLDAAEAAARSANLPRSVLTHNTETSINAR